ncbi:ATP-binding protein [Marinoscillum luteum]|uniref:histidine kinase n=1 Tax=Marinoscillum luteum TaxID=861051 RepID=A0ABW7N7J1_9BACT
MLLFADDQEPPTSLHRKALSFLEEVCKREASCVQVQELTVLFQNGDFDKAYEILIPEFDHCTGEKCFLLSVLKAKIFYEKSLIKQAINEYKVSLDLRDKLPPSFREDFAIEPVMASLLLEEEAFLTAIQYLRPWVERHSASENKDQFGGYYHNLGIAYLHLKKFDSSAFYFNRSIEIEMEMADTLGLAISYMDIANLYYEQYLDDQAIPYFQKGLEYALLAQEPEVLRNAYLNMAVVEENRGDLQRALSYRKDFEKVQNTLWNRDKVWEMAEKEKTYEIGLKEREITILEQKELVKNAELSRQRWQIKAYLIASVFLFILAGVVAVGYRIVSKSNKLITEQKRVLEQMDTAKNRLFSIVAHDLKAPVRSLQRSQQKMAAAASAQDKETLLALAAENGHLLNATQNLLNNLLQWSLDQTNQVHLMRESIEPGRLIEQVLYDYEPMFQEKGIDLETDFVSGSMVLVDIQSMKVVFRNLLDNALKFTPKAGRVLIATSTRGDMVRITIEDTGCGMEQGVVDRLFEISQAKIQAGTDGTTGTGLGMILCQAFVSRNGGTIEVESQVGKGTIITLNLPRIAET